MAKKNWVLIADKQFAALDKDWQNDWSELRKKVGRH
jgi:hypothetical protein